MCCAQSMRRMEEDMLKLMKYEMRKQLFSKILIFVITAVCEAFFVYSVLAESETKIAVSIMLLYILTIISLVCVALEGITTCSKDLKTKQSYMLFLVPRNTYQILGAKTLVTFIQTALLGLFFGIIAFADVTFMVTHLESFEKAIELINEIIRRMFGVNIDASKLVLTFIHILVIWFSVVVIGFIAVILTNAVLTNVKGKGFISGVIMFVIYTLYYKLLMFVDEKVLVNAFSSYTGECIALIMIELVLSVFAYIASAWMLDKKVSV